MGSITRWEDLKIKFLSKYCPLGRTAKKMEEINNFQQEPNETLYQAWEQFKELLMKCPQHYLTEMQEERGFRSLPSSTEANPVDHVKLILTTAEANSNLIRRIRSPQYAKKKGSYGPQFLAAYSYGASHIDNSIPRKEKDPGSFTLPCYINNVCFDIALADLGASLMRDQVNDLMPTIEEGEVIDEPMIDIIKTRNNESFDEEFYNSIMRDEVEHKEKNVVGAFMNVLIFVRKFSFVTHFIVVENMDGYQDQDMGDIILGEPLCKSSCVKARRFNRLTTIHNSSDNVTYQMA
ncbi:homeodomain-like protein [Tanacetum coccineum]